MNSGCFEGIAGFIGCKAKRVKLAVFAPFFCAREPWNHWFPHVQALSSRNDEPEKASRPWDKA